MSKPSLTSLLAIYANARAARACDAITAAGYNPARSNRLHDACNDALEACIEACLAVSGVEEGKAAFARLEALQAE